MKIILDVDEVLVDFVGAACRVHGTTKEELHQNWEPGNWAMTNPLKITEKEFWKPIHEAGAEFWETLEPLPWMDEVLEIVARASDEFFLVTAPSRSIECHHGKINWIKKTMGDNFSNFLITSSKHILARPGVVIIDDRETTVHRFIEEGGSGIVFPAHHNSKHLYKNEPILYLQEELRSYL